MHLGGKEARTKHEPWKNNEDTNSQSPIEVEQEPYSPNESQDIADNVYNDA
jgi:hypothetical protein